MCWFRTAETFHLPAVASPANSIHILETEPQTQLNFALWKRRGEAQRLARRKQPTSMHVERGESARKTKHWAHLIVDAGKICVIRDVEPFCCDQQSCFFPHLGFPAQAHIEVG